MRLYNTLTRRVDDVVPVEPGRLKVYTCGPTVYRYAHIGNLRTFLLSDLVRRAAEFEGLAVTQVINITDVGHMVDESSAEAVDKMQLASADEGLAPLEIAAKYTEAFLEDAAAIGILPPHELPTATGHIPEMLDITQLLIDRGHAYETGGSVYYDVTSFPHYGALSGNTLEQLRSGHRQELEIDPNKRFHADFALWKKAGAGRLMKWDSPWGEGFPGWHVECSAMSMRYLGDRFDVHTGGADLIFPHHEDEIAQSDGAVGHRVISTWVHGGHLRMRGQKMAKSTGNVTRVIDLATQGYDPLAFRLLTFQTRYRSEMDFTDEAMDVADRRVKQLRQRMQGWATADRPDVPTEVAAGFDRHFRDAVADDLDMPRALVVLNEAVGSDGLADGEKYQLLASWDAVLGLDLEREAVRTWEPNAEMRALMSERDQARAAKDYAKADELRARLTAMDLEVMDSPEGTKVRPRA
ncbi:MAG: cysteine--tRNA ligase [Actinomycetota bacterium]